MYKYALSLFMRFCVLKEGGWLGDLEISDGHVKCQKCGQAIPIIGKLQRSKTDRIAQLERRIKQAEFYYKKYHDSTDYSNSCTKEREEHQTVREENVQDVRKKGQNILYHFIHLLRMDQYQNFGV
jgi:hypothetical protein